MINADRYRHTGRTYVNISRAPEYCDTHYLGLTPQAKYLSPLRGLTDGALSFSRGSRPRLNICRRFAA